MLRALVPAVEARFGGRHRRVLQPAFGPRTYALVCVQTSALYDEMLAAEGWAGVSTLELPSINLYTNKVRFLRLGGVVEGSTKRAARAPGGFALWIWQCAALARG